jgi:hypothetical protein
MKHYSPSSFDAFLLTDEQIKARLRGRLGARCTEFAPVARFALYSGGDDSLVTSHWLMSNGHCDEVLSIDTGIGLKVTRRHIRATCSRFGWPLVEVRAKEDCGIDYRQIVLEHGFPGPPSHGIMYNLLKERAIDLVVRQRKRRHRDRVLLATGIRNDESQWRAGYGGQEVTRVGAQVWANPFYWISGSDFHRYRVEPDRGGARLCRARLAGVPVQPEEQAAAARRRQGRARQADQGHRRAQEGVDRPRADRAWWKRWPNALIGLCTGHPTKGTETRSAAARLAAVRARLRPARGSRHGRSVDARHG